MQVKRLPSSSTTAAWSLVNVAGVLYFAAPLTSNSTLFELWRSDGTTAGTMQVAPGVLVSNLAQGVGVVNNSFLAEVAGTLYFTGRTTAFSNDFELWKIDGTSTTATLVKDIRPCGKVPCR